MADVDEALVAYFKHLKDAAKQLSEAVLYEVGNEGPYLEAMENAEKDMAKQDGLPLDEEYLSFTMKSHKASSPMRQNRDAALAAHDEVLKS